VRNYLTHAQSYILLKINALCFRCVTARRHCRFAARRYRGRGFDVPAAALKAAHKSCTLRNPNPSGISKTAPWAGMPAAKWGLYIAATSKGMFRFSSSATSAAVRPLSLPCRSVGLFAISHVTVRSSAVFCGRYIADEPGDTGRQPSLRTFGAAVLFSSHAGTFILQSSGRSRRGVKASTKAA